MCCQWPAMNVLRSINAHSPLGSLPETSLGTLRGGRRSSSLPPASNACIPLLRDRPLTVDIAAPGESIWTTASTGGYSVWAGTSFAAPFVGAVASLVKSKFRKLTHLQARLVCVGGKGGRGRGQGQGRMQCVGTLEDL